MSYTKEEMLEQNRQSSVQTLKTLIGKLEGTSTLSREDIMMIRTAIDGCIENIVY